jgi:Flp pilus assembly protein TadD
MSTSFTKATYRGSLLLVSCFVLAITGCATKPDIAEPEGKESKYEEQRKGGEAEASDAGHVPPVPHSEELESVAKKASPEYVRAIKTMGKGNYKKALVMLQSLSSRFPQLSGPIVNQGIAHIKLEQYEDAEEVLKKALQVNDRNPYAHNNLGVALREQGEFEQARKHYRTALELDPKYARAHFNLAVLAELYLQDLKLALKHFQRYQELQKEADDNVANWIADLKRRVPDNEPDKSQSEQQQSTSKNSEPEKNQEEAG